MQGNSSSARTSAQRSREPAGVRCGSPLQSKRRRSTPYEGLSAILMAAIIMRCFPSIALISDHSGGHILAMMTSLICFRCRQRCTDSSTGVVFASILTIFLSGFFTATTSLTCRGFCCGGSTASNARISLTTPYGCQVECVADSNPAAGFRPRAGRHRRPAPLWKTCQAFRLRYQSVLPDLSPLTKQLTQK